MRLGARSCNLFGPAHETLACTSAGVRQAKQLEAPAKKRHVFLGLVWKGAEVVRATIAGAEFVQSMDVLLSINIAPGQRVQ